jgi:hypothetical protein
VRRCLYLLLIQRPPNRSVFLILLVVIVLPALFLTLSFSPILALLPTVILIQTDGKLSVGDEAELDRKAVGVSFGRHLFGENEGQQALFTGRQNF